MYRLAYKRLETRARRGKFARAELDRWRADARELLARAEAESWPQPRFEKALTEIAPKEEQ